MRNFTETKSIKTIFVGLLQVQLLHCIRQCEVEGGDNQFVDAKRVVDRLKAEDPESFETLTKVKLDFRLIGKDFIDTHLQQARPMIE